MNDNAENPLNRGITRWRILLDTPCAAGARSTSFPPAVPPEEVYLKQRFSLIRSRTSVQRQLIWCPNSHLVRSIMSMLRFWKFSSKSRKIRVRKRSLNRLIVLVSFINGDPFSDRSKSKVQTTSRQEPCHTPQIPFAKINYFPKKKKKDGHQFFFTTGWKERFAQLRTHWPEHFRRSSHLYRN